VKEKKDKMKNHKFRVWTLTDPGSKTFSETTGEIKCGPSVIDFQESLLNLLGTGDIEKHSFNRCLLKCLGKMSY
jgi:hypothetical protein